MELCWRNIWKDSKMKRNRDKTGFAKYRLLKNRFLAIIYFVQAGMAELADALDLGSSVPDVQVQVLSSALDGANLNCDGSCFAPFSALHD